MDRKGITLIELLVALCVSAMLLAGVYKTFISQQHTFTVQDQVADMQQNVRLAVNRMTRELRMAGFGGGGVNGWTNFFGGPGSIYGNKWVIVPGNTTVTIVEGYQPSIPTTLSVNTDMTNKSDSITVGNASSFNTGTKKYISINGWDIHEITSIQGNDIKFPGWNRLTSDHLAGEPVYLVQAITYSIGLSEGKSCLLRDDNLGAGAQPVAENVETLRFTYFDANGNVTANPPDIRMIQLNIVARTDMKDPDLAKTGDGFRRRTLNSNIQLRNLLF